MFFLRNIFRLHFSASLCLPTLPPFQWAIWSVGWLGRWVFVYLFKLKKEKTFERMCIHRIRMQIDDFPLKTELPSKCLEWKCLCVSVNLFIYKT